MQKMGDRGMHTQNQNHTQKPHTQRKYEMSVLDVVAMCKTWEQLTILPGNSRLSLFILLLTQLCPVKSPFQMVCALCWPCPDSHVSHKVTRANYSSYRDTESTRSRIHVKSNSLKKKKKKSELKKKKHLFIWERK